jgi:hypothetical protein
LGCEPGGEPIIDNQHNQDLTIYVQRIDKTINGRPDEVVNYGVVPAKTTKKLARITFVSDEVMKRIEVVDTSGNVVFSHDYNMNDLEKIQWKIIIPP